MTKHGRGGGSRRKGYRYLPVDEKVALSTLSASGTIASDFDSVVDDRVFAISLKGTFTMEDHTPGEGPIVVGIAHSDYTAAEIDEFLEAIAAWDSGDQIAQEHRRRFVRWVGTFDGSKAFDVLNDGMPISVPLRWWIQFGETLALWAWNKDLAALTTGTLIGVQGGVSVRRP